MSEIEGKYLKLRGETNALDFLEKASQFIKQTENDHRAWKWVIIALHGALYGFAICVCQGSTPNNVTTETKRGDKLIGFCEAIERCQKLTKLPRLATARALVLTDDQRQSMEFLTKELRNNFEHYIPRFWSIELHGMPKIAIDVLDVLRFLALDSGTLLCLNEKERNTVEELIAESKRFLENSDLYKEALLLKQSSV